MVDWEVGLGRVKLTGDPGRVLPVTEKAPPKPSTPSSCPLGANDEYFRKNHERDLRQQGHLSPHWRRRSRGRLGGVSGRANRRRRTDPGQGGRREERKAGIAKLDPRPD